MNSIEKLNNIIDISKLPSCLPIADGWEMAFVASELDSVLNKGYVPFPVIELMSNFYVDSIVCINDSEPTSANEFKFCLYSSESAEFSSNLIDDFHDKTGCWGFVAEFEKDGSFVVGLDQEYVLIISPKENGFISFYGGASKFKKICLDRFDTKHNTMNKDIFLALVDCIY